MSKRKSENKIESTKDKKARTIPFSSTDILMNKIEVSDRNAYVITITT